MPESKLQQLRNMAGIWLSKWDQKRDISVLQRSLGLKRDRGRAHSEKVDRRDFELALAYIIQKYKKKAKHPTTAVARDPKYFRNVADRFIPGNRKRVRGAYERWADQPEIRNAERELIKEFSDDQDTRQEVALIEALESGQASLLSPTPKDVK